MIACDFCNEWFHYDCIGIKGENDEEKDLLAQQIEEFTCPFCLLIDKGEKTDEIREGVIQKQQKYFKYDMCWLLVLFYEK